MKRVFVISFLAAFSWAGAVMFLTNAYLRGNLLLGAPLALMGGAGIGTGLGLWLRRRLRKAKTYWTE